MIGIGKYIGVGCNGGLISYEPELATYITGLVTPLSSTEKTKINIFVVETKTATGVSSLAAAFDLLYLLRGETSEIYLKNLAQNAFHATLNGAPAFVAGSGVTPSTGKFLKTGYTPATHHSAMSLDSCSHGVYINETIETGVVKIAYGVYTEVPATSQIYMMPSYAGVQDSVTNGGLAQNTYSGDSAGFYCAVRDSSTTSSMYVNNSKSDHLCNSVCLPTGEIYIGCRNLLDTENATFNKQLSLFFLGKKLTQTQMNNFQAAFNTYRS
jgi:hypothetical protein